MVKVLVYSSTKQTTRHLVYLSTRQLNKQLVYLFTCQLPLFLIYFFVFKKICISAQKTHNFLMHNLFALVQMPCRYNADERYHDVFGYYASFKLF